MVCLGNEPSEPTKIKWFFFFRRTLKWSGSENLFKTPYSFPLDIYPEVGLLDHTAVLFLIFWGLSIPLSTVAAPIYGRAWSWPSSSPMPHMGPGQQQLSPLTSPHLTPSGIVWPRQKGDVKGTYKTSATQEPSGQAWSLILKLNFLLWRSRIQHHSS